MSFVSTVVALYSVRMAPMRSRKHSGDTALPVYHMRSILV
jgi:hypothetical protein